MRVRKDQSAGRYISIINRFSTLFYDRRLREWDLTTTQMFILVKLYQNESLTQQELATFLCLDKGSVSRSVATLISRSLVARTPRTDDGRSFDLRVTDKAREMEEDIFSLLGEWTRSIMTGFSVQETADFLKMLDRCEKNARRVASFNSELPA